MPKDEPQAEKKIRRTDRTLALCNRIDREFEKLPDWGRAIVVAYLKGKWESKS